MIKKTLPSNKTHFQNYAALLSCVTSVSKLPQYVVGIDLSGPANIKNTGIAVFFENKNELTFIEGGCDGADSKILSTIETFLKKGEVVVVSTHRFLISLEVE